MGEVRKRAVLWVLVLSLLTISLLSTGVQAVILEDTDGPNYGDFSWAMAYVKGESVNYPEAGVHCLDRNHPYDIDDDYPYGGYAITWGDPPICQSQPIYANAYTEVILYNAWGEPFSDSWAYAIIYWPPGP